MEITITEENFDEVLKNNPVAMVDFGATWCGPCKALAPVVEEIANEYEGRAAVGKAAKEFWLQEHSRKRVASKIIVTHHLLTNTEFE